MTDEDAKSFVERVKASWVTALGLEYPSQPPPLPDQVQP